MNTCRCRCICLISRNSSLRNKIKKSPAYLSWCHTSDFSCWMDHYSEFYAYYSLVFLRGLLHVSTVSFIRFVLDINGMLNIAIYFSLQSVFVYETSFFLLHVAMINLFSLLYGISLYKSISIHLCILPSMGVWVASQFLL